MKKHLTFSLALLTIACATINAQLPSYLPADGLVGWWPFNGNANDESGNGNDGVVNGATLAEDRFGNLGSAYYFDGVSDYINCGDPSNNQFEIQQGHFTISAWINLALYANETQGIVGKAFGANVSGDWNLEIPPSGLLKLAMGVGNTIGSSRLSSTNLMVNSWVHVTGLYHSMDSIDLYVNGVFSNGSLIIGGGIPNSNTSSSLLFGKSTNFPNNQYYFNGIIDDIAIYNRALTPQEIQNLYTGTNETVAIGDGAAPLPQGIPYQAAARDAQGQVIADAPVNVRFSLREGAVDGAVSYSETHALTTNSIGLFNTVFGNGTAEQSAFDSINWAATTKFLQVEIDLGDGYVDMGTTQLLSVPYAFRSDEAARIKNAGLPIFANNTAALAGGLMAGEMYRTASGDLKVAY